jgi:hypothetical protein
MYVQVLSFPYDVYHDTIDGVATEMQQQIGLSVTDTELVAAAMREVLARQLPGLENVMSVRSSLAGSASLGNMMSAPCISGPRLQSDEAAD